MREGDVGATVVITSEHSVPDVSGHLVGGVLVLRLPEIIEAMAEAELLKLGPLDENVF